MYKLVVALILLLFSAPKSEINTDEMVQKVNEIRSAGCTCGGKKMSPVESISWNQKLYNSAISHADDMKKYRYFSHYSRSGKNVGERVDRFDYKWTVIGENIAEGQSSFDEALDDWIKSPSHCKMIMDPNVNEMGVARSGRYWVQHFGKQR